MKTSFSKNNKGFTLVEMLVSVALFSIILIVVLGTITTLVDTSRKARSLTEVMNDLNFTFESMTRSVKTATDLGLNAVTKSPDESILTIKKDQNDKEVKYIFDSSDHAIYKQISGEDPNPVKITSDEVVIDNFTLTEYKSNDQPRIFIAIKGKVVIPVRNITSSFNMQTTISQRQLNL